MTVAYNSFYTYNDSYVKINQIAKLFSDKYLLSTIKFAVYSFVFILFFLICAPLFPFPPVLTWPECAHMFAVNEAAANGRVFGVDIIWTYGPYMQILIPLYHPKLYNLMLLSGSFLGVAYFFLIYLVSKNAKLLKIFIYAISVVIVTILFNYLLGHNVYLVYPEIFLNAYPLLVSLVVYRLTLSSNKKNYLFLTKFHLLLFVFSVGMLGLLPLIKGTYFISVGGTILMSVIICYQNDKKWLIPILTIAPLLSSVLFWSLIGQPLSAFPSYVKYAYPLISGYTEAMALQSYSKSLLNLMVYCIGAGFIIAYSWIQTDASKVSKVFLHLNFLFYLWLAFKHSYVSDVNTHTLEFASALLMLTSLATLISIKKDYLLLNAFSIVIALATNNPFSSGTVLAALEGVGTSFTGSWNVLKELHSGNRLATLQRSFPTAIHYSAGTGVPLLQGTTDMYVENQMPLFQSHNKVSLRPIFKSYAVYTPILAALNEKYLRTQRPDNILFTVHEGHYPALYDGHSWPTILTNYHLTDNKDGILYLKKNASFIEPVLEKIYDAEYSLQESIVLPSIKEPLFAEIDIQLTLLGKMALAFFKVPRLRMTITLHTGESFNYTIVSGMVKSGFILSPFIKNNLNFIPLINKNYEELSNKRVATILIEGHPLFWQKNYILTMKKLKISQKTK